MNLSDYIQFKGHFTIQSIDKDGNIIDEYKDPNMIMESSRTSMSKIFSQITGQTGLRKFVIGTMGHNFTGTDITTNITSAKAALDGYVKERDRLFSEFTDYDDSATSIDMKLHDLIRYSGTGNPNGITGNYYIWVAADTLAVNMSSTDFTNASLWLNWGATKPYNYTLEYDLPGVISGPMNSIKDYDPFEYTVWSVGATYNTNDYVVHAGTYYQSLVDSNIGIEPGVTVGWETSWNEILYTSGSTASVNVSGTTVTLTFDISQTAGNGTGTSIFTEAALYTGDDADNYDIFSMKTFKAKVKDNTVLLRTIWSIIF